MATKEADPIPTISLRRNVTASGANSSAADLPAGSSDDDCADIMLRRRLNIWLPEKQQLNAISYELEYSTSIRNLESYFFIFILLVSPSIHEFDELLGLKSFHLICSKKRVVLFSAKYYY